MAPRAMSEAGCRPALPMLSGLQDAIDAVDVIGNWDWDIPADRVYADALVALLFGVDPDEAERGAPLSAFVAGIHAEDRERVRQSIDEHARAGSSYLAEYRVCSADGVVRWVLSRGRFTRDASGRALRGKGILIDITRSRVSDAAFVTGAVPSTADPLERAADAFIAGRQSLDGVEDQPFLRQLADLTLLEIGRALAAREKAAQRTRMN